MNEKEIAEIRRRFRPDKNNISHICGCYVNERREIVSEFDHSLHLMPGDDVESMLGVLRRTLSGGVGKNLLTLDFDTQQVVDSPEHRLLMELRSTGLKDQALVHNLFVQITETLTLAGDYLILLAHDRYDIPYRSKDGEKQPDASSEVFSYILCGICPIKVTKPALGYYLSQNEFHLCKSDWLVSPPELGFLFPAFSDRSADIYSTLYYCRNVEENHQEFVDAVFRRELPMPAAAQKETFEEVMETTLADACSYDVVQAVHGQLRELVVEHKANKEPEPLVISKATVRNVLEARGVAKEQVAAFEEQYDASFGAEAKLSPQNVVDVKQLELRTPDVTIRVNPDRSDLVETRIIGGRRYILIRADEGVEVNGVNVHITE